MSPIPIVDFKSLFATLPGLYLILTPGFTIAAVSDSYLRATMTERETIIGRGLFEIFPDNPDDKEATGVSNLRTSLNAVLQLGQPHKMAVQKYDIRRPNGVFEERYWSQLNSPVFNEAHELLYIIHQVVDVTDQHRSAEKLKKGEKDYQLLISSVKDYAIFMVDPNGLVASWNSGAESIKGYSAAEIIGKPISVFYTAEDIKQGVPLSNLQKAMQYGHFEAEGWRLRKDGTLFWANIVFTALKDEAGVLYGYSKITRDITERKNAQNELESLTRQINQSNDAIFTIDINRKILSWNMGAQNLYGFAKEEVLGKDIKELFMTVESAENVGIAVNSIAERGYWTGEARRKTKTGEEITVRSSVTAIKDHVGVITGYVVVSFDVTEQKRLREQVNHLGNIVEQSSEAIVSRGIIDQRFISWNIGAERLFGYSKEEAIGKTPLDLGFTLLTDQEIAGISQQVIEKGSWSSEREFFHKNGSSFFGTVTANAVRNEEGEITSMVFIIKDISLRKELENQLKKYNAELEEKIQERTKEIKRSEEKYLQLFENNPLPIWVMDTETTRFIAVNEMAVTHYGYSREEFLNMSALDIRPEEDKERFRNFDHSGGKDEKEHNKGIWRHRKKDGSIIYVEIIAHQIIYDDIFARIILANDVSERKITEDKLKASESRFRALIENSNDVVSLMDESFKIYYRSPSAFRITGWTDEAMINADGTKNIHPDDVDKARDIVKELMANPGKPINCLFRNLHKDGHYLWMEGVVINLLDDEYVKAIVFNFRDVTQRIEAEEKLVASEIFSVH